MAPHSSTLAWKIPWTEEPGSLKSMGSQRVGHESDFPFTFHFHALEKEMATHSSIPAWEIPWTEDPSGLQSWASLVAQLVKNPPAMWETWVRSLGWEDPLEKGKASTLETRPDSPGEFGMQPRDPCRPWSGTLCPRHKPR